MRSYKNWIMISFWIRIVVALFAAGGYALDYFGVRDLSIVENPLIYLLIVLGIFVVLGVIRECFLWYELKDSTPNIEVIKTYTDKQYSQKGDVCLSFARVVFSNRPIGNNPEAKSIDTYAEVYYFDDKYNPLIEGTFIGRWGTSKNMPKKDMEIEELANLRKIDFEATGLTHDLDVAYMFSHSNEIYGFDNDWLKATIKDTKKYFLANKHCYVMVTLHGIRFLKDYYFKVYSSKGNFIIKKSNWSKKSKKEILKKKKTEVPFKTKIAELI